MSPNFHPIRPRPTPLTRLNLVPQIRPKVPGTETHSGAGEERAGNLDILSNDNNGVWFIEEKIKDETQPLKREFLETENKTTVNPALTEKPRTWPSVLKKKVPAVNDIYNDVTIVEKSKNGQIGDRAQSTTFSTSRVQMSVSTTPRPEMLMKIAERKRVEDFDNQSDTALRDLMLKKAHKLLDTLAHKERDLVRENAVTRPGKRKRLRQQPKSLPGAESEGESDAYVVYPMAKAHTENKDVDQIFNNHPGLKRISAYDFEKAMSSAAESTITKPVAELKVSIEELADTMTQLTRNVLETSPKAGELQGQGEDRISQLQEEIAKLTRTLETLQLAPRPEQMLASPTEHVSSLARVTAPPPHSISSHR